MFFKSLNSCFSAKCTRACTAVMTFSCLSSNASVVPTGACADMSDTFMSAVAAKRLPSSTMVCIKLNNVWLGSLYGSGKMLSRIVPEPTSTSRNSPGAIGVSSPLILSPRVLRPPGKLDRVPASTSCRMSDVADLANPPIRWKSPNPYAPKPGIYW